MGLRDYVRQYEEDGYQAIVLSSFGEWIHYAREGEDDDGEIRNGGAIPFYGVWGINSIFLTVEGDTGLLNINGVDVGALEVDNESAASDVTLIVGLFENSEVAGFFTKFKEFIVTEPGLIAKPTPRPTPTPTATPPSTPTPTPWVKSSAFLSIEREYKWLQLPRDTYWAWEVDNLTTVVGLRHVAEQLIDEIDAFLVGANRESIEYKTALEYRSDASYFVTTGTYYIREVEARPTPTPRPRPRATATPTPRPRPTATPTPRPRPRATATPSRVSSQEVVYLVTVATITGDIGKNLSDLGDVLGRLSGSASVTDAEWQVSVAWELAELSINADEIRSITSVPSCARSVHSDLVSAANSIDTMISQLARGIDNLDIESLNAATVSLTTVTTTFVTFSDRFESACL